MQKIWKVKSCLSADRDSSFSLQKELKDNLGISQFLAQLLINRSITTAGIAEKFLNTDKSSLNSPETLPDIKKAKGRIHKAIENKEKVLVFSDYDADGVSALAVLKIAFEKLGLNHEHYLPHRLKEGYGLSRNLVSYAHQKKFNLIITLDCGIGNFEEIEELRKLNIDVIVIDHHEPLSNNLPAAHSIINPKISSSLYPYRDLAGVGLAYKFASYLLDEFLEEELDLVCLGTVADVVPLLGENRFLVKEGLKKLNNTKRPGLRSLIGISGIKNKKINTVSIGYILGPRINACGRLDSSESALKLLLCSSDSEAEILAKELHSKNQERQRIESKIMEEAVNKAEKIDFSKERVIVLYQDGWHQGVLGIVAAKITDRFYRPTIVISFTDELGKGSGRSIDNFHLFESLLECKDYLHSFGGHRRACGLNILKKDVEDFIKHINRIALERLTPLDLFPSLAMDLQLNLSDLSKGLLEEINLLEPFGEGNPVPLFLTSNLKVKSKPVILGKDTLKFWVSDSNVTYPAVGFRMGSYFDLVNSAKEVDLAYRLSLDNFNGNNQLQLEIEDIRLSK